MKRYSFLPSISLLPAALLVTLAASSSMTVRAGEPRRIYDLESQQYIDNPDYHEPASEARAAWTNLPYREPRRLYDLKKEQYVTNPAFHEAAPVAFLRPANDEPRRMYDVESGQYVLNPDYQGPTTRQAMRVSVGNRTPAVKRTRTSLPAHKTVIAPRTHTFVSGHGPV